MKDNDIPQGYKESPLGVIPHDWEVRRLGEVCTHFKSGLGITADKIAEVGEYPVYGGNGLRGFCDSYTHYGDYVLIGRQGALCGNINFTSGKSYISEHAIAVQVDGNIHWLKYKLDYWNLNRFSESSAQPGLSVEKLIRYKLTVPPLAEQERIAEVLGTWDEAIDKQSQLVKALERRKRALMQQLLTARKRLPNFSAPWQKVKLRDIFNEVKDIDDGQGVYSAMTISAKEGLISQQSKFDRVIAGDSLKRYTLIQQNDFAYNKGNSKSYKMGCVYRLTNHTKALVPFVYICFRCKNGVDYGFYEQWFRNHGLDRALMKIITSGARGDGLLNVNTSDFFNIFVPNPQLEEQKAIAQILTTADKEIELATKKLETLRTQKRALMQQLLTGKKRLKI